EMFVDDELCRIAELAKSRNSALECVGRLRRHPDSGRFELLQPHDVQIVHEDDASVAELRGKIPKSAVETQMPLIKEGS
ncbi:MAG: hypothetical protein ABSH09_20185, partial [Bryobacteraceae bacterium]